MSMTVPGKELAPRAVRIRNVCLRAIAKKRGLPEPTASDLAQLKSDVTLTSAVLWWERGQVGRAPMDIVAPPVAARSNLVLKAAAISVLVLLSLLAFPREAAGFTRVSVAIQLISSSDQEPSWTPIHLPNY